MIFPLYLIFVLFLSTGCSWKPSSPEYRDLYAHLEVPIRKAPVHESEYFVVLLVDARHLDYTSGPSTLKTIAKHPSDGSKNSDVGHAWIYLQGIENGVPVFIEGGHSGERGIHQAKYFEGVMNYIDYGYANPNNNQRCCPRHEPNPIKYLSSTQTDGFFQWGAGGHTPTFAAKIDLTKEQFQHITALIHASNYPYRDYALIHNQCCSFVAKVASIAGLLIDYEVTISIPSNVTFGGETWQLWTDPQYAHFTFSSPDILERSLMQAVRSGKAQYALSLYLKHRGRCWCLRVKDLCDTVYRFPPRFCRVFF